MIRRPLHETLPVALPVAIAIAGALTGCSAAAPVEHAGEVEVLTMRVVPQSVTAADELPGRVVAFRTAEIRPQVGGIVRRRSFEQGAAVRPASCCSRSVPPRSAPTPIPRARP